jgi:hypothetical protein
MTVPTFSVITMPTDPGHFLRVIALIDAANANDPHREHDAHSGTDQPRELLYGQRMSAMLERFCPDASMAVKIAVRAQHIRRWEIPRDSYPRTPFGYKQWRTHLYRFHAEKTGELMREAGYAEDEIERVRKIVGKLGIKVNPETQLLEDVASLVFLAHTLTGFAAQHPEYDHAKWIDILQKTWRKMSPTGQAYALQQIELPAHLVPLIHEAAQTTSNATSNASHAGADATRSPP